MQTQFSSTTIPNSISTTVMSGMFLCFAFAANGTGTSYDFARIKDWEPELKKKLNISVQLDGGQEATTAQPDLRSPIDHLNNIKEVLKPTIADLASTFGVSRQAILQVD